MISGRTEQFSMYYVSFKKHAVSLSQILLAERLAAVLPQMAAPVS